MSFLKKNNLNFDSFIIFIGTFSFYFLWDINNFFNFNENYLKILDLRLLFLLLIPFTFYKFSINELKKYYFFFLFFFFHEIYVIFYLNIFEYKNIYSFLFLNIVFIITIYLKDKIILSIILSFYFFTLLFFFQHLYYLKDIIKLAESTSCSLFNYNNKFIFFEKSHFSMIYVSAFLFFSYTFFNKKNIINFLFLLISSLLFLSNFSLIFFIGLISSIIIFLIIKNLKFFTVKKDYLVYLLIILVISLFIIFKKKGCYDRLQFTEVYSKNFEKNIEKENNYIIKLNKENNYILKLNSEIPYYNLSLMVYVSHLDNMYKSLKEYPLGIGINNYHLTYLKRVDSDFNRVISYRNNNQLLNINDGRAVAIKGVTEFGFFSLLFLIIFWFFIKSDKVCTKTKVVLIPLILTPLIGGAGYFNGGFIVSFFLIITCLFTFKFNSLTTN